MNIMNMVNEVVPVYCLPFSKAFLLFLIMSFVGWTSEVIYVGIVSAHKFVNRGFLHGPICPIYGFGGLVILTLPQQLYSTWIPLFFASMILCTTLEYFGSWILEKLFHTTWWDYSHYKLNINGRVCLVNAILFGLMGVLCIHFVIPYIMLFLNSLSDFVLQVSSASLALLLTVDMIITVKRLVDFNATMEKLKEFNENLKAHYENEDWFHGETLQERFASVKAKAASEKGKINASLLEKIESFQARQANVESFIKRFPTLKSAQYHEGLAFIKEKLNNRKNK